MFTDLSQAVAQSATQLVTLLSKNAMASTAKPMVHQAVSHPLRVSWVANSCLEEPYSHHGSLAISACPGAKTRSTQRNIKQDLSFVRDTYGISHIVCLLNDAELRVRIQSAAWLCASPTTLHTWYSCLQTLGIRDYQDKVSQHGMSYSVMPVIDMAIPESAHDSFKLVDQMASDMAAGKGVLVHCRQGVGRAGMIAACVLLRLGCVACPQQAIDHVRSHRHKCAVQTARQEQFVHWYGANMSVSPLSLLPVRPPFASRAYCGAETNKHIRIASLAVQQAPKVQDPKHTRARKTVSVWI